MKLRSFLTLAAGVLLLAGCSSTPTKVDSGPVHARTFNFVARSGKPSPAYADNRQAIHSMIQGAIAKNLAGRGVTQLPSGGDVTVAYLIIAGNNASTTSINDYFGYGEDAAALHDKANTAYTGSKNPNFFEAGTLVIDIIDSKSFKLLRRGYATRPILRNLPDDARAARLQEVVDEIFQNLRIQP
jgi:outer membrane murein-binding lipoprotein Lpp